MLITIGISITIVALYRLWKLYKRSSDISKNSLLLGLLACILCFVILDGLTGNNLIHALGKTYYNRFVGVLVDSIVIGALFREPNKGLSHKEIMWAKFQLVCGGAILSWYFMYYLCK